MLSFISIDKNNIYKIIIVNFAPFDVTIDIYLLAVFDYP